MENILLVAVFLFLVGCGGDAPKPVKVSIPPVGQKPAAPAKESPRPVREGKAVEARPDVDYTYNPQGKPNPFQPLVVEKPEMPAPKKKLEQTARAEELGTPLEKMELANLKLVAVVWDISNPRAMVEDPGGKGYILTLGTRIGKNKGQVSKITSTGLVVSEKYITAEGKLSTREVPLPLYVD